MENKNKYLVVDMQDVRKNNATLGVYINQAGAFAGLATAVYEDTSARNVIGDDTERFVERVSNADSVQNVGTLLLTQEEARSMTIKSMTKLAKNQFATYINS